MTDRKEPPFFNDDSVGAFHYKLPFYDSMELLIETLTGTCFELRVLPFEAVVSVKAKIQRLEGIPVAQQHLIWNNLELDDEHCLHDYGIAEGCTLKLVLAMRGGPINTRRVTMEDPIKEVSELMDSTKEDVWEKSLSNKQVTFVVYRENDQLNFFRVVDRGDGTLTPLSESLSGGSVYNVCAEEEEDGESSAASQQNLENSVTMNKMKLLKSKMEDMNLNKKPKKSVKIKPRPPVSPHPGALGLCGPRQHQRLFRSLPQINQPWPTNTQLPPIADHEPADSAPPSAHFSVPRRAPPSFSSPSCYMLQEEEPWEACPPFAKIRPPPKVSRLDVGGARLMRDCVYPQLPPLCVRGPPDAVFEPAEPAGDAVGLSLLEDAPPFGELSDPLSLDVSGQPDAGRRSPSPLGTWTLGTGDAFSGRGDGMPFRIGPPSPCPAPPSSSTQAPPPPFDATLSRLQPDSREQSPCAAAPAHPPPRLRGVKVESAGRRAELTSHRDAKMADQAHKEPPGSARNTQLLASLSDSRDALPHATASGPPSVQTGRILQDDLRRQTAPYTATSCLPSAAVVASLGRKGAPTYHLPPVKAAVKAATGIKKKKSSKNCFLCGKKTGLACSYECRCGHNFCATHRYAETHDCTYDYKSAGRRFLHETNPLISAPKLPKI